MKFLCYPALLLLAACGTNPDCDKFAEHLADIMAKEHASEMTPEIREKMVTKTRDACNAAPPKADALKCGLAAESSEAIKACEKKDDKEEG